MPARPKVKLDSFADNMRDHLASLDFTQARHAGKSTVLSPGQVLVLTNIHRLAAHTVSPLQSLVERLNPVVNYLILPLFAFVNAGVHFGGFDLSALAGIPLAIFLGLFVGKTIGIFTFSYLAAKARIVSISPEITKRALFGVSILGGIGSSSPPSPLLPCPTSATNCSTKPSWASLSGRSSRASSAISS